MFYQIINWNQHPSFSLERAVQLRMWKNQRLRSLLKFAIRLSKEEWQGGTLGDSFLERFLQSQRSSMVWLTCWHCVLSPQIQHTELKIMIFYLKPTTTPHPHLTLLFTVLFSWIPGFRTWSYLSTLSLPYFPFILSYQIIFILSFSLIYFPP